jgi:SAM-dependent methyltransferase
MSEIWQAQRASFERTARSYDAGRPEWPAGTAAWLVGAEPGGPLAGRAPLDVLDLGAGTGKLTRTLVDAGHRVTALDPSAGMLAVLSAALPDVRVFQASAEALPLPDASLDAVAAAQAWHWVEPEAAAAECARVLRPGGVLGVGWHVRDDTEPWVGELDQLVGRPDSANGPIGSAVILSQQAPLRLPPPFGPLQREVFDYQRRLTPEGLVDLVASMSYVAVRDDRDQVLVEVLQLGRRVADQDGELTLPYRTFCYRAVRQA